MCRLLEIAALKLLLPKNLSRALAIHDGNWAGVDLPKIGTRTIKARQQKTIAKLLRRI
jgi:hypothetical protein